MNLPEIANSAVSFFKENPVIAVIAAIVLLVFIYLRPKLFFGLLILASILIAAVYFIMGAGKSGSFEKGKLIQKEERQFKELK